MQPQKLDLPSEEFASVQLQELAPLSTSRTNGKQLSSKECLVASDPLTVDKLNLIHPPNPGDMDDSEETELPEYVPENDIHASGYHEKAAPMVITVEDTSGGSLNGNDDGNPKNKPNSKRQMRKEARFAKTASAVPTDTKAPMSLPSSVSTSPPICVICNKPVPKPHETQSLLVKNIKPRILRQLKKMNPHKTFHANSRICIRDLNLAMQSRIEDLLAEDQTQLATLQDNAMKNLEEHEIEEENWQVSWL